MRIISLLLVILSLTMILCSCGGAIGPQGPQGEIGPAGQDGASFLTGNGVPSADLGKIGDSYLDLSSEEWGLYVKGEDGWKLMGYIEAEPAPLTISELNGSYRLSHVVSGSTTYNIGDSYAGLTLSADMIQVDLNEGTGHMIVNFGRVSETDITCTIEYNKLVMICKDAINMTGEPSSVYELSIVRSGDYVEAGEIYVVLEAYGDYYYVKKMN